MNFDLTIYFLGITIVRSVEHNFLFHCLFLPLTLLLVLCQQSPVLSISIFNSVPPLSMLLLMQSPSQFLCSSPPFPLHFTGICSLCQRIIFHLFHMASPSAPHQFRLRIFPSLQPPLSCHSFSPINTQLPQLFLPDCFPQTWTCSCCLYVNAIVASVIVASAIVANAFMCAGVTHELSIFPLRLGDMRLSPITPSTFL